MKKFFKTLWGVFWPVAVYLLTAVVVEIVHSMIFVYRNYLATGEFDLNEIMDTVTRQSLYSTGVVSIISIIIFTIIIANDRKKYPEDVEKQHVNIVIAALMASVGACLAGNVIISATGITLHDEAFNVINEVIMESSVFSQILVAVILGPVTEELLFRGIVYKRVERSYGFWPALIVSSILFGVMHGNLSQFLYAAMLGILFAYVYHISGSLLLSVVMHVVANATSLVMDAVTTSAQDPFRAETVFLAVGAVLLAGGLLIMVRKNRREPKKR